jgi:uncharacterized protein YtpQ (UPF0354 family)
MTQSETSPMDSERFAQYLERRLSLHEGEIQIIDRQRMELRLLVGERETMVDLTNYYRAYRQKPDQIDAVAQTLVRVLLGELSTETDTDFEAIADRVCLMLKPASLLAEVAERKLTMLVYRQFLADLIIVYTITEDRSIAFINEDHLERWGIAEHELHDRAITNLRRRTIGVRYTTVGEGEQRLFIYNSGDGYDASRLFLNETVTEWARMLPGQIVIGIPSRDFLIAFSAVNPDVLQALAAQIQTDALQPNGLTDQLFTYVKGAIREYEWE